VLGDEMADSESMTASVLAAYRTWKEEGEALKVQAQGCLMDRFADLIREAQQVQHDLFEDFGVVVKFPSNPKLAKKGRVRPVVRKAKPVVAVTAPPATPPAAPAVSVAPAATKKPASATPAAIPATTVKTRSAAAPLRTPAKAVAKQESVESQRAQLNRKIQKAEARLKAARESGDPVRVQNAEDRLYELKDDLQLLTEQFQ
jgi:hypothetical protein